VPPGQHTVEFDYNLPNKPLYITVTGLVLAALLSAFLLVSWLKTPKKV